MPCPEYSLRGVVQQQGKVPRATSQETCSERECYPGEQVNQQGWMSFHALAEEECTQQKRNEHLPSADDEHEVGDGFRRRRTEILRWLGRRLTVGIHAGNEEGGRRKKSTVAESLLRDNNQESG